MNNSGKYCYDNTAKSIYEQIADIIKNDISNGKIPLGKQLLPELKLAESFNVSLVTMQRALKVLAAEKLITRSTKRGTFISDSAVKLLRFKNIGLIMPRLNMELTLVQSPTHYLIFDGIQKYCLENSWDIQIISKKDNSFSWERISQSHISGFIIVIPQKPNYELIYELKEHQIPFTCINLHSEKINKDVNFVNIDFYNTAIDAVKYLHEKGKRNIAIVSTQEMRDDIHQFHIINGYKQAVKTLSLKENIITVDTEDNVDSFIIRDFFRNNFNDIKKYDAIITMDSNSAISMLNVLNENKIKIPEELSLITFSENEDVRNAGITSYVPDLQNIGYNSAVLFNEILNDKHIKQLKFKLQLFPRDTA